MSSSFYSISFSLQPPVYLLDIQSVARARHAWGVTGTVLVMQSAMPEETAVSTSTPSADDVRS